MNVIDHYQLMKAWGDLCTSGTGVVEVTNDGRVMHRRTKDILEMQESARSTQFPPVELGK
ncbi:hypothetical protein [Thalassospira xiamenensis]|uniref:hypothetical protein n=1 Tax=Thalassospira xiamenensis TaxID=220697 RepID=UPI003AA8DBBF